MAQENDRPSPGTAEAPAAPDAPTAPSPPSTTPSNGSATDPPGSILDELSAQLQDAAAKAAESQQASKALQDDLTALQRAYDEVGKLVDAYDKARPALTKQAADSTEYIDRKRPLIIREIGDAKQAADDAWKAVHDLLADLEHKRHDLWSEFLAAQDALAAQTRTRDAISKRFDELKARSATLTAGLKRVADLKTGIEAADAADDAAGMYVRLFEFDRELTAAKGVLADAEVYRGELDAAWRDLEHAQSAVRDAAATSAHAKNQYEIVAAELERLSPNRVSEVLKRLAEVEASESPPVAEAAAVPA